MQAKLVTGTEGPMTSFDSQLRALKAIATLSEEGQRLYLAVIMKVGLDK